MAKNEEKIQLLFVVCHLSPINNDFKKAINNDLSFLWDPYWDASDEIAQIEVYF